jgi:Na+/glutamate symporter
MIEYGVLAFASAAFGFVFGMLLGFVFGRYWRGK